MCTWASKFSKVDWMTQKNKVHDRRDIETRFKQIGDKPLSPKLPPINVRLPSEIDEVVRPLPNRSEWLRRVITEAARRELIQQDVS